MKSFSKIPRDREFLEYHGNILMGYFFQTPRNMFLYCIKMTKDDNNRPTYKTQVEVALEIAPDQTVPDKWDLWSDRPRPKWPLIRRVCARRSLCARSALKAASDQTSSRPKWPLIRQVPDHCPDEFQTIVQTRVRSKYSPRLKCGRNHLWSDKSALEVASV